MKLCCFLFLTSLLFFSSKCYSKVKMQEDEIPWFGGTLLSFYATNTPPKKISIQPFFFNTRFYGIYDSNWDLNNDRNIHQYQSSLSLETGITEKIDIDLFLSAFYTRSNGKNFYNYGDTKIFLGFQISEDKRGTWIPDYRVVLGESFPTGKFNNLEPGLKGGDASGAGSYQTLFIMIVRKIFYTKNNHPYNWNLNLYYINSSKINVNGISIFGGDEHTKGVVKPGEEFIINLSFEYKFNQSWGIGMDMRFEHQNSSSFHRKNLNCSFAELPSFDRISLSPCLEYNFSATLSLVGGIWFSVAGRNAEAFTSGGLTLYYEF